VLSSDRNRTSTATGTTTRPKLRENWSGFDRRNERATAKSERQQAREQRREQRDADATRPK
jgi:hypothetical protein